MKWKVLLIIGIVAILFASLASTSALTYNLKNDQTSGQKYIDYSASYYKLYLEIFDNGVIFETKNFYKINSIKVTDNKGKSLVVKDKANFTNRKTNKGYSTNMQWRTSDDLGTLSKMEVNFKDEPDLAVVKYNGKGYKYSVTVKNVGNAKAKTSYLGVYNKNKLYKKIKIKALKPGESKTVSFKSKYKVNLKSKSKKFKADYNNKVQEVDKYNNAFKGY